MTRRLGLLFPLPMAAGLVACADQAVMDPAGPDDPVGRCHPLAGKDVSPAVSQRVAAPADVVAWAPPPARPFEGPLAANDALEASEPFGAELLRGPEDVVFDAEGRLYTGTEDGTVWRASLEADGRIGAFDRFASLESGRPLGLAFDACGNLLVAAAAAGLVGISPEGEVRTLVDRVDGTLVEFADELAVAADGTVYVTDASVRYDRAWPYDFLEGRPNGRILAYEPSTGMVEVVADELYFANGILVSEGEDWLLVAESTRLQIRRHWLAGPAAGTAEVFAESLPLIPDNLARDSVGSVWVTGSLRTATQDELSASAESRLALVQNYSFEALLALQAGVTAPYGLVLALSADGAILNSLHGEVAPFSAAEPRGDSLYLGRLNGRGVERVVLTGQP